MKNRILIYVLLLLFASPVAMADEINLGQVYRQLDEAIEKSPQYVALRQEQINKQCKSFYEASDPERKLMIAEELFALYDKMIELDSFGLMGINKQGLLKIGESLKMTDYGQYLLSLPEANV